jgi:hypothetical protein
VVGLQEEEQPLLIEEFLIVLDFILSDILIELFQLLFLVLIMLDLPEEEEPRALLALLSLLLLL